MRVLVTGGAGFIGSHVVDELLLHGHVVRVLDSLVKQVHPRGAPSWLAADTVVADVRDPYAVRQALTGMDALVHLAARVGVGQSMYQFPDYLDANVRGTSILLDAIVNGYPVEKIVVASSMSIYGEGPTDEHLQPLPTPETEPARLTSPYALSKWDQERLCLMIGQAYSIPVVPLRFFNVYGPRQSLSNPYTGAIAIFASQLMNGQRPYVFEDGKQRRDFVFVRDVARAVRLAVERHEADFVPLNIGSGADTSIGYLASALAFLLGVDVEPFISNQRRAGDVRHCFADVTLAQELLGFRALVQLEQGLPELVEWLRFEEADDRTLTATAELQARGLIKPIPAHVDHPASP